MKNISLLFLLVAFSFTSFSQTTTEAKKTKTSKKQKETIDPTKPLVFKTVLIERFDIPKGTNDMFEFEFVNKGKTPVLVQNIGTSCGCTTASKPEKPIAPKEKSKISVKYDTNRVGPFEKTITVTTNVGTPIILTIKGTVLGDGEVQIAPAH
ncbi:MAG: DUF1573 domain-containing protein [Crocinitomicaceae bacterium]